jgi:hypothetical protein
MAELKGEAARQATPEMVEILATQQRTSVPAPFQ